MDSNKWWSIAKNFFKIAVSIGALYWLYTQIKPEDFAEIKEAVWNANPLIFILAMLAYICSLVIASSRLTSFFRSNQIIISERYNLKLYHLGLLYNYFIPGGIGGDAYKIFFLKKRFGFSGKKLLSSIFFDRLSGLWALSIYVGTLVIFMPRLAIPNYVTISAMVIGTGTYYYLLRTFFNPFSKNFVITHFKALCAQGFQALAAVLIMYALNFEGKFSPYILVFMLSSIVAIIPSLFGGFGTREPASGALAKYLQITKSLSILVSLVFNFISIIIAATGVYYILRPQGLGTDRLPSAKEVEQELEEVTKQES